LAEEEARVARVPEVALGFREGLVGEDAAGWERSLDSGEKGLL